MKLFLISTAIETPSNDAMSNSALIQSTMSQTYGFDEVDAPKWMRAYADLSIDVLMDRPAFPAS